MRISRDGRKGGNGGRGGRRRGRDRAAGVGARPGRGRDRRRTARRRHPFLIGRHWLFVAELRPDKVTEWLSDRIAVLEAPTWGELAEKIGRIGEWEFEDYPG